MRLVLALAILTASAASAHASEDRYGPARAASATAATSASAYAGPMLSWSGKAPAVAPPSAQPRTPARPEVLSGGLYRPSAAPMPAPAPVAYAPPAAAPAYAAASPAPTSLYSRPTPQAAAVDTLPPPPSPTAVQSGLYATGGPRFYSVHRPYGEMPDPIPAVPQGERMAYRPEASLAGAVALSGVGDGVRPPDAAGDDSMAGVGAAEEQEQAERDARREAERAAARRAAAGAGK